MKKYLFRTNKYLFKTKKYLFKPKVHIAMLQNKLFELNVCYP